MPDGYLKVTNWNRHQHYKDRNPIWIKFYVELLDDTWMKKQPYHVRLLWDQLLLLAARFSNAIPNDSEEIAALTRIQHEDVVDGLDVLLGCRWLSQTKSKRRASKRASNLASELDSPEGEVEVEREKELQTSPSPRAAIDDFLSPLNGDQGWERRMQFERLLSLCSDKDEKTAVTLRTFTDQVSVAGIARCIEALSSRGHKDRSRYAVGMLKSMVREGQFLKGATGAEPPLSLGEDAEERSAA